MTSTEDASTAAAFIRKVDFGRTAADYRRHRLGFPPRFFERLAAVGIGRAGQHVLDLGTGTGSVARGLALAGADVTGLDPAKALMAEARAIDVEAGADVQYVAGRAEQLPFPTDTFDIVAAGQCWHWFGRAVAAAETFRVLTHGGRVMIAHFDWVPLQGNVVAATEELIRCYNPEWLMGGGTGLYPQWLTDLAVAGFRDLETFSFDLAVPYTHQGWRGRIRASAGVKATLTAGAVEAFDRDLEAILRARFPEDPLSIPHRTWAVIGHKPV